MDKCPQCGYSEKFQNKPMTNDMSEYVNVKNDKDTIIFNSREPYIEIGPIGKQVKYRRVDYKEPSVKPDTSGSVAKTGSETPPSGSTTPPSK